MYGYIKRYTERNKGNKDDQIKLLVDIGGFKMNEITYIESRIDRDYFYPRLEVNQSDYAYILDENDNMQVLFEGQYRVLKRGLNKETKFAIMMSNRELMQLDETNDVITTTSELSKATMLDSKIEAKQLFDEIQSNPNKYQSKFDVLRVQKIRMSLLFN